MNNLDFINDILPQSIISRSEIISNTIFVDANPIQLEFTTIKKVNGEVEKTTETLNYQLHKASIKTKILTDYGLIYSVSIFLDKQFIKSFENNFCLDEVNFYSPFLLRLFKKPNIKGLVDELVGYDWVITTNKVLRSLRKFRGFQEMSDDKASTIKLKGKIDNTIIFTSDYVEEDTVWKGNSNNCLALILNDIYIDNKDNIYDIKFEYLFNTKGVRKLSLL